MNIKIDWIFKEIKYPRIFLIAIFIVGFIIGKIL